MELSTMHICNSSIVLFMRRMSFACLSYGKLSPTLRNSWWSKFEIIMPSNANTSYRVATHEWINQRKLTWCVTFQALNLDSVTTATICCTTHPARVLWFEFSWSLAKHMQATQRFARKVVMSFKVVYRPLMNDSIILGLEYSTYWPICSSLSGMASLVFMLTCCL